MKIYILILLPILAGCSEMFPAKAAYVKKMAKNTQAIAENQHQIIMHLKLNGVLTDPVATVLAMQSSQNASRAAEISRQPASISLPPGSGAMGKGILGMMMGNPMAMGTVLTGLMSIVGGGIAVSKHKKMGLMQTEGRAMRDANPDDAKKMWENSDHFGKKPA